MLEEVPFGHEFLDRIDPVFPEGMRYVRQVADLEVKQPGFALVLAFEDDGVPLLVVGAVPLWPGVGEVFTVIDRKLVPSGNLRFAVSIAKVMLQGLEESGFKRLQGQWRMDCPCGKLAKVMGFRQEGILRNAGYGGKGDYVIAARTS